MTQKNTAHGFTVLYAMLIAGMLLAVGMAIFEITYRETNFAIVARDSNLALYAADTGEECALYWDYQYSGAANFNSGSIFATSSNSDQLPNTGAFCAGADIIPTWGTPIRASGAATTTFLVHIPNACAEVVVAKYGIPLRTTITSRGYNTPTCPSEDNSVTNRIERALQANY